eukprot:6476706-Amphidinium_carterae.1
MLQLGVQPHGNKTLTQASVTARMRGPLRIERIHSPTPILHLRLAQLDLQAIITCSKNRDYVAIPACHGHEECGLQV